MKVASTTGSPTVMLLTLEPEPDPPQAATATAHAAHAAAARAARRTPHRRLRSCMVLLLSWVMGPMSPLTVLPPLRPRRTALTRCAAPTPARSVAASAGGLLVDRAVGADNHPVLRERRLARHVALGHIARDQRGVALERIPPAASAGAGLHDDGAGWRHHMRRVDARELGFIGAADQVVRDAAREPPEQAPGGQATTAGLQ